MIVEIGGNQGQVLYINTDIDYGTVFLGESLTDYFTVYLTGEETSLDYSIELTWTAGNGKDMRPYLTVWKATEGDSETDWIADGPNGDYDAAGTLSGSDTSDKWWVTFDVPNELGDVGDYWTKIMVEVVP